MIYIPVIEEFDNLLEETNKLIDLIDKNAPNLKSSCINFIKGLESAAEKYNIPLSPELSVIRGKILTESYRYNDNMGRKEAKAKEYRFIVEQLEKCSSLINDYFKDSRRVYAECERTCCQVLTHLRVIHGEESLKVDADSLIRLAEETKELAGIVLQIKGLAGIINTRILFDKAMVSAGVV